MGITQFLIAVNNNLFVYTLIVAIIECIIFRMHWKSINDIFNPLTIALFVEGFAVSCPIMMLFSGLIEFDEYVCSFFLTVFALHFGIYSVKNKGLKQYEYISSLRSNKLHYRAIKRSILWVMLGLYSLVILYCLVIKGTYLSYDNHVEYTVGLGVVGLIQSVLQVYIMFLCWDRWFHINRNKYLYLIILFVVGCSGLIFGSKASLLVFGTSLFFYRQYIQRFLGLDLNVKKYYCIFIGITFFGISLAFVGINGYKNFLEIIQLFCVRLAVSGDMFAALFYDKALLNYIIDNNDFYSLVINPILGVYRIVDYVDKASVGNQIMNYIYNIDNYSAGVNNRYNLFLLLCFGNYLSVPVAYFAGLFIGYVQRSFMSKRKSIYSFFVYIFVYQYAIQIMTGPDVCINAFKFLPLFLPVMWVIYKIRIR